MEIWDHATGLLPVVGLARRKVLEYVMIPVRPEARRRAANLGRLEALGPEISLVLGKANRRVETVNSRHKTGRSRRDKPRRRVPPGAGLALGNAMTLGRTEDHNHRANEVLRVKANANENPIVAASLLLKAGRSFRANRLRRPAKGSAAVSRSAEVILLRRANLRRRANLLPRASKSAGRILSAAAILTRTELLSRTVNLLSRRNSVVREIPTGEARSHAAKVNRLGEIRMRPPMEKCAPANRSASTRESQSWKAS